MDQPSGPKAVPPNPSVAVGQLIVKLRNDGLFTDNDVQIVLRKALASAALAISAAPPTNRSALAGVRPVSLAAE